MGAAPDRDRRGRASRDREELVCRPRASAGPCSPPSTGRAPSAADRRYPTDGTQLEAAARKVMSQARIRLRRRLGRFRGERRGQPRRPSRAGGSCHGCSSTRPSATRPSSSSAAGTRARSCSRRSASLTMAHDEADLAVARGARDAGVTHDLSAPRRRCRWRRSPRALGGSPRWFQLYWSSDDDLVDEPRRAGRGVRQRRPRRHARHGMMLGWRPRDLDLGHLPFARGEGIAQYTSRPASSGGSSRERVAAPDARPAAAASDARPRSRTLLSMSRNHPGGSRRQPHARRAARRGRDVPRRLSAGRR